MFDILYIPYRDLYFWKNFGSAVRDLQILEVLNESTSIDNITILNRPVSIYERALNKRSVSFNYPFDVDIIDTTSFDLLGPLKKRAWTVECYNKVFSEAVQSCLNKSSNKLLIIDFTPFSLLPIVNSSRVYYWYDMIDNFTKHNCYSSKEKELVRQKYSYVANHYNYLTSVSEIASSAVLNKSSIPHNIVPNGVFHSKSSDTGSEEFSLTERYDFGFIGFVTDKFDVNFVSKLAQKYSVVVYGDIYNNDIASKLMNCGIDIKGKFIYSDLQNIVPTFKVGLLPYLIEKSHDGSPLKLYEYLKYNRPCLTSIDYEYRSECIVNYNLSVDLENEIENLLTISGSEFISESLPENIKLEYYVNETLKLIALEIK